MADAKEILKKLGFDLAKVESATDINPLIEEHNTANRAHYEGIFKNEEWKTKDEFDAEVKAHDGKTAAIVNNALKKLGITDIDSLPLKEKIEKVKEWKEAEFAKLDKGGKDEVLKLQEENISLKNQVTDFPAKIEAAKKEAETIYEGKIKSDKISLKMKENFVGIPKERVIGNQHSDGMFKAINATISANYDADIDEKGDLVFYNKGSKTRPVTKQEGKEILMSAGDIFTATLKELNFYVESNGQGKQGKQEGQAQQGGQQKFTKAIPPEMEARQKELETTSQ